MTYSIEKTWRYRAWQQISFLTGWPTIVAALFSFLLTVILILVFLFVSTNTLVVGSFVFTLSILAVCLHLFIFATSYRHFLSPSKTVLQLQKDSTGNILLAASLPAVSVLTAPDPVTAVHQVVDCKTGEEFCQRLQITKDDMRQALNQKVLLGLSWQILAEQIVAVAAEHNSSQIEVEHAVAALFLLPDLAVWLRENDLLEQDIGNLVWWVTMRRLVKKQSRSWWRKEHLLSFSGIGLSWVSGFTPLVDSLSRIPAGNLWDQFVSGRRNQFKQLIANLARQDQSNVLLVGQPGVGRLGLVKELVRRVRTGQAHPAINDKKVVYLHIGELLAQAGSSASQLSVVSQALREMERAGNVLAVIDGLSSVLGQGEESQLNLTDVLLPFFSATSVKVVVIMSNDDYHLRLKGNEELLHFFEVVEVASATPEVTMQALIKLAPIIEKKENIYLPYKTLRALVNRTSGVMQNIPYPERAFDVLAEALVEAQAREEQVLLEERINEIITRKVGVPVGDLKDQERQRLLNLEEIMHRRVVNQTIAIQAVSHAMIRARAGVRSGTRPIGTFLFLGPTGVGKTETAKTLAEAYFGNEDYIMRFDMSEFSRDDAVANLIGSSQNPVGRLTSAISDKPFAVVLLDEFEKASRAVQQMFLQVFDEGHLTDVTGKEVSFDHAIIIATSNAGAEMIRKRVEEGDDGSDDFAEDLKDHILENNLFRPELLNRFDGVITFAPLSRQHIHEVARRMLTKLNRRLDNEHGITVAVTDELIDFLVEVGYNPEFGARPMSRAIQDYVEYAVAQQLLRGFVKPGQQITLQAAQLTKQ